VRLREGEEDSLSPSRKVDLSKVAESSKEKQAEVHSSDTLLEEEESVDLDHREEAEKEGVVRIVDLRSSGEAEVFGAEENGICLYRLSEAVRTAVKDLYGDQLRVKVQVLDRIESKGEALDDDRRRIFDREERCFGVGEEVEETEYAFVRTLDRHEEALVVLDFLGAENKVVDRSNAQNLDYPEHVTVVEGESKEERRRCCELEHEEVERKLESEEPVDRVDEFDMRFSRHRNVVDLPCCHLVQILEETHTFQRHQRQRLLVLPSQLSPLPSFPQFL